MMWNTPTSAAALDRLTARERVIAERVTDFAHTVVLPRANALDEAEKGEIDWDIIQQGHDLGLFRTAIPESAGGLGLSTTATCVILEEMAACDPGVALIFGATGLFQIPILLSGDQRLQGTYLTPFLSDEPVLACNAVTEAQNGTDLLLPWHAEFVQDMTTARPDGDRYLLNGTKKYITNAPVASFATVYANLEGHPGSAGLTCFVVDLDQKGVERGQIHDKVGYRAAPAGELVFHDAVVPAENVVGGVGNGWDLNVTQANMIRVACAAVATGIARRALAHAHEWCGIRRQGGGLLHEHQLTARKLADMTSRIDASRLLYLHAAEIVDNPLPPTAYEPAVAKLVADRAAVDCAEMAASLVGAQAFQRDDPMGKIVRDSHGPRIYEGTPEALAMVITRAMYGKSEIG